MLSLELRTQSRPKGSKPGALLHHSSGVWRSLARHEVRFYSHNAGLLDDLTRLSDAALKAGNAAIVVATESHRNSLLLDSKRSAWILVPLLSRGDTSRWMLLTCFRNS